MLYLLWWSVYDLFFSICSLFVKKEKLVNNEDEFFFIVIPALGEGQVLFNTIERALAVDYPQDKFQVVLLAQNIDESVSKELRKFPIKIIESGPLGSKMNAIRNWLKNEELTSESMFILDADNEILPKALSICSGAMKSTKCVQLTRKKTEPTSPLGLLDRWNTEVGIAIAIHSRLVLSRNPFIVGSGFGIKANLYQRFLDSNEDTIVEDKALDLFLIQQGEKPIYLRAPGVLDSSISRERQFTTQRSRWIGGKVQIKKLFRTAYFKETGNIELFDKWLHYSNPQRSIRLVLCLTWSFLYFLPNQELDAYYYLLPFALEIIAISIATPSYLISTDLFLAFLALPKSIIIIIKSRIIAKRTVGKDFKVTPK
tara:strand:- start:2234 stop:3343 length:1110 start_codon:yes stop_codon:yes gene_type:complete